MTFRSFSDLAQSWAAIPCTLLAFFVSFCIYQIYFHPLAHIKGPLIPKLTPLWLYYHSYVGDESSVIDRLHKRYGPVLRIAPNEVDISDGAALGPIYSEKGGFRKTLCYRNFDIDGHQTLFSTLDAAHRAVRAKAVISMFSTANVRKDGGAIIESCVDKLVARLKQAAQTKKRVNLLHLGRALATDTVTGYLFGKSFETLNEEVDDSISVGAFVDTFVAVGRFFYWPAWWFQILEMFSEKMASKKEKQEIGHSMSGVDQFVENVVTAASKGERTYQARLLDAGITKDETMAQCKDLIFAGTDSSGMNMATACYYLAKFPDRYARLRAEVLENPTALPETLPYLSAVVKEALRISMANPTRLPRLVPDSGWVFNSSSGQAYHLPKNTQVGCAMYSLHHNEAVYPQPYEFIPERWLDATPEMQRDSFPFGLGARQCIARNLANAELFAGIKAVVRDDALKGARPASGEIEIIEWFNSRVRGEKIELVWE